MVRIELDGSPEECIETNPTPIVKELIKLVFAREGAKRQHKTQQGQVLTFTDHIPPSEEAVGIFAGLKT